MMKIDQSFEPSAIAHDRLAELWSIRSLLTSEDRRLLEHIADKVGPREFLSRSKREVINRIWRQAKRDGLVCYEDTPGLDLPIRSKACQHRWHFVHTVYAGKRGGARVRRYCLKCKQRQVGFIKWREERTGDFDHAPWSEDDEI